MKAHRGRQKDRRKAHYLGLFRRYLKLERRYPSRPDIEAEKDRLALEQRSLPFCDWARRDTYEDIRRVCVPFFTWRYR